MASGGHSSSRCAGLSLSRPLLLRSTGSRHTGSVVVAHGPSCSASCGIFPDQGSNPCPLHWQADSQPLRHQGSPITNILIDQHFIFFHDFIGKMENHLVFGDILCVCVCVAYLLGICLAGRKKERIQGVRSTGGSVTSSFGEGQWAGRPGNPKFVSVNST